MTLQGHVRNGVVVLDEPLAIPEGTLVRVEAIETAKVDSQGGTQRQGGQYAGQIWIAPDFDEWPADLHEALGMSP